MAVNPRGFDRPDYQSANAAIDMVLAQQTMKDKRRNAKKKMRSLKDEWRLSERQKLARGATYEAKIGTTNNRADVSKQIADNINAADKRLGSLTQKWYEDSAKMNDQWSNEFNSKAKFSELQGAQRAQAYTDFYSRRSEDLDSYKAVKSQEELAASMRGRAKQRAKGYYRAAASQASAHSRYRGGQRNARQAHSAYEAAVQAYNALNYVPWSP